MKNAISIWDRKIISQALIDSVTKLNPEKIYKNPVMFVVLLGTIPTTLLTCAHPTSFGVQLSIWLWFTLLFANFAEALAEGRGHRIAIED